MPEWASGDHDAIAEWEYHTSGNVAYHQVYRQIQIPFDENNKPDGNGMANWGNVYWATDNVSNLTVASGQDIIVRNAFISTGELDNSEDTDFRQVQEDWPVFAFAVDLGAVGQEPISTLFTIGLLQQQAVQFLGASGLESLPALWTSYFTTEVDAVGTLLTLWSTEANMMIHSSPSFITTFQPRWACLLLLIIKSPETRKPLLDKIILPSRLLQFASHLELFNSWAHPVNRTCS